MKEYISDISPFISLYREIHKTWNNLKNFIQLKIVWYRNQWTDLLCKSIDWFLFDRSFYSKDIFDQTSIAFFFSGNTIRVSCKRTLNTRNNVQLLYTVFLIKNQCYVQLLSNTKELFAYCQQWPRFGGYNLSVFFAVVGEDGWQYFGRCQPGSSSLLFAGP